MGILTWIFVDGHFATLLNFTPTPLMVVLIALVVAVGFGLATDYEVFLVSRMVEARERGMSTAEAIRIGTATTGRLITAAALVLAVVAGSFVFSDLVMMKYLAFGLMAALLLDATVVRMFLVPSVMKLLGDDCWWAPRWMKRLQNRIGLGEIDLPDERKRPTLGGRAVRPPVTASAVAAQAPRPPHDPTHPGAPEPPRPTRAAPGTRPEPRPAQELPTATATEVPSGAATGRMPTAVPAQHDAAELGTACASATRRPRTGPDAYRFRRTIPVRQQRRPGRAHRRSARHAAGDRRHRGGHRKAERPRPGRQGALASPGRRWRVSAGPAPPRGTAVGLSATTDSLGDGLGVFFGVVLGIFFGVVPDVVFGLSGFAWTMAAPLRLLPASPPRLPDPWPAAPASRC